MNEGKRPDKYSGYEKISTIYGDDGNLYWIYRKIVEENGDFRGLWAAAPHADDRSGGPDESKMFDITYAQARGFEPISETSIGKLRRTLGKKLLPQRESIEKKRLSEKKNSQAKEKESAKIREIIDILEAPKGLAKKYGYTLTPEYVDINHGGRWPITKLQYNRLKELGYGSTNESYGKKAMNKRRLNERYPDYDPKEWEPEDIELHKSIDWKARNYEEYEVPEDSFVSNVVCYRRGASPEYKRVEFHKFIRSNPIYPPYYAPAENPFGMVVGPMYDGRMHGKYGVHDRYEDQETYDRLNESYEDYDVDPDETAIYLFPLLDRDDIAVARRFGLWIDEEFSDEDTTAISGRFEDLADFAENYLDYQLVDGYLFDENGDEIWLNESLNESIPAKAKKEIAGWWKEVEAWNEKKKEYNIDNDYDDVEGMHTAMFDMLDELKSKNKDLYEKGRKIYNKYSDVPIKKSKVREAYEDEFDDDILEDEGAETVIGIDDNKYARSSFKSVRDSDGFMTDYTAWIDLDNLGHVIFIFGDNDLYNPSNESPDWECDSAEEAQEWFDNYTGFDDEDDEDYYEESLNKSTLNESTKYDRLMKTLEKGELWYDAHPYNDSVTKIEKKSDWQGDKYVITGIYHDKEMEIATFDSLKDLYKAFDERYNCIDLWNLEESLNKSLTEADTLAKPIKRDIKRNYKSWDSRNSAINKRREEIRGMLGNVSDGQVDTIVDTIEPKAKPFGYELPGHLETKDFPFYVTYYEEHPYYHPEEGGYYVAGRYAASSEGFDSKKEAIDFAEKLADENGLKKVNDTYYNKPSKYIGDEEHIWVETARDYLSHEKGDTPYE